MGPTTSTTVTDRRTQPPRRPRRRAAATIVAVTALVLTSVGVLVTAPPTGAQTTAREPIVFVHGYYSDATVWDTMKARFVAAGYPENQLFAWGYNWQQSNVTTARELDAFISTVLTQTGAARVDIVAHSMGSLSSRWCLKYLYCLRKVDDWVSLGGPNHGTPSATACPKIQACIDMTPGSGFLNWLNAGDESPGLATYQTIRTNCDNLVPATSVPVAGATNLLTPTCITHVALLRDQWVFDQVRGFVDD